MTIQPPTATASKRIATIDVMRAIIMLLMLFVNDIPGVDGLPHWLGHAETEEDHRQEYSGLYEEWNPLRKCSSC